MLYSFNEHKEDGFLVSLEIRTFGLFGQATCTVLSMSLLCKLKEKLKEHLMGIHLDQLYDKYSDKGNSHELEMT